MKRSASKSGEKPSAILRAFTPYMVLRVSKADLLNKEARPKRPAKRNGPRRNALPDSAQLVRAALFACVRRDFFQKADHHVRLADINAREVDRYKRDD